ncbi:MAG: OB-fold nucleic acid binding domain-containing protein, partial [Bacillota bacterium]|nr:OB-fold nucleic acid binding domain-containing protein [Bacillota bacterium]
LSLQDFCERMAEYDINRRTVESLIRCGAFDSTGARRSQLMNIYDRVIDSVGNARRQNVAGQMDLFGSAENSSLNQIDLPDIKEFSQRELLAMEKASTGLFLSGHPMTEYSALLKKAMAVPIIAIVADAEQGETGEYSDGTTVTIGGVVTAVRLKTTKSNSQMAYITLEDTTGSIESLVFAKVLSSCGSYLKEDSPVILRGRISAREDEEPKLIAEEIRPLTELDAGAMRTGGRRPENAGKKDGNRLYLRFRTESDGITNRVLSVMRFFPGISPVTFYFEQTKKRTDLNQRVRISEKLVAELRLLIGEENVIVK